MPRTPGRSRLRLGTYLHLCFALSLALNFLNKSFALESSADLLLENWPKKSTDVQTPSRNEQSIIMGT
jgi:hypothetical protein